MDHDAGVEQQPDGQPDCPSPVPLLMCRNGPMRGAVTLSASYGAHGDKVGRALAGRLQLPLPFVDRAIPTAAAARELGRRSSRPLSTWPTAGPR